MGFPPGCYVRVVLNKVPASFVRNVNLYQPLILGGLLENEQNMGITRV